MVTTAIALKRYQLRNGKPAPSLESLVPEFLPQLPVDWMDGKALRYRLNPAGSWTLYSVGTDGKDDGGDPGFPQSPHGTTVTIESGRDLVWPTATPNK